MGDAVRFTLGKDAKGRTCTTNHMPVNDDGRISALNVLVLFSLLVLPAIALLRR